MITDALLNLISSFYRFLIGLMPSFNFLDTLITAKNEFINFISSFISYTLYLFNVPVLKFAVNILIAYLTFLVVEYVVKLALKYMTNLL